MDPTDMGTDARVFYIALLSLQSRRQNNLNGLVKQLAYRMHPLSAYLHPPTEPHPQPLSPWRGVGGEAGSGYG